VEQTYRDNRLNMIHEGTNGIQSLDLLGRKMRSGLTVFVQRIRGDVARARSINDHALTARADQLEATVARLQRTTELLVGASSKVHPRLALANSHEYLNMTGHTTIAWMWLRQELAVLRSLQSSEPMDAKFIQGKRIASEFFFRHELPKTEIQARLLESLDDTVLRADETCF
jgi:hypothetical protein